MQLQVKGKGLSVTDALFDHAEQKLDRLTRILPPWDDATTVELELSTSRDSRIGRAQIAEVTVRTKGAVLRVREAADDMYAAIDQASRKLERQARKYRERRKDHSGRAPLDEVPALIEQQMPGAAAEEAEVPAPAEGDGGAAAEEERLPRLVKSKSFVITAMSAEDAALHMDMVDHDFYVFRNERDGQVNVVYRRRDGDYGLIEPGA
ncbi:ribosome hibernation-promoting factor, HPF/YfiA family [Miltoncostaea marina]|uniref:ribosome hibernation-promoting factor, HPF/YfiA family n=1 Tax=Miltoncostaea marina TaxID=2843215 RepID=UPI001C3DFA45|nr:ribosome-associated translation inhibitor RaiA [Miltoncostaea marina]